MSALRAFALWLALATAALAQDNVTLSLDQGRQIARQALLAQDFVLARELALGLLQADPNDRAALIVLAAAAPQLGRAAEGRQAGARAFRLSTTRVERYEAARVTALAAANEERFTLTQYWLRRAAANAPDERALAQTRQDFQGIRRMNPWNVRAQLSFSPSNNVNGGSEVSYNLIDGLPFVGILSGDAQALPGVSSAVDLTFGRRISAGERHRTTLSGRVNVRRVWLNEEGRAIAPDSENSDFGSTYVELTALHQRRLGEGNFGASLTLGGSWFAEEFSYPFARVALSYDRAVGDNGRVNGRVSFEQRFTPEEREPSNSVVSVDLGYRAKAANGAIWSVSLEWEETRSDNLNVRNETWTAQASYQLANPVGPATLTFSVGAMLADYPDYAGLGILPGGGIGIVSVGRRDERVFGSVEAAFYEWSYAGFAPIVTVTVDDTESTVTRFQRNSTAINFGLRSTF